ETDTEDLHGNVTLEAPLPSRAELERVLPRFLGTIQQVPPAYSAKRIDGERAYKLARKGEAPALEPVAVEIHSLMIETVTESADGARGCRIRVGCGGGTYIRSLARDIARAAGSGGHLTSLRRERAGVFTLARSVPLERLREGDGTLAPAINALEGYP